MKNLKNAISKKIRSKNNPYKHITLNDKERESLIIAGAVVGVIAIGVAVPLITQGGIQWHTMQ